MEDLIKLVELYIKVSQLDKVDLRVLETLVQNIMMLVPKEINIEEEIKKNQIILNGELELL